VPREPAGKRGSEAEEGKAARGQTQAAEPAGLPTQAVTPPVGGGQKRAGRFLRFSLNKKVFPFFLKFLFDNDDIYSILIV